MIVIIFLFILIIFFISIFYLFFSSPFKELTEELINPILENTEKKSFFLKGCEIKPIKKIYMEAIILSKKDYRKSNLLDSFIVPYDFVFGWKNMSKKEFLDVINISQNNRWFFYNYKQNNLFQEKDILENFDNFHIIPKDEIILDNLRHFKIGDIVRVEGFLVSLNCPFINFSRGTSLSFKDRSATSCEQIYITNIEKLIK
jgi:hypothetical protein